KTYGKGSIQKLGQSEFPPIDVISTGSNYLDAATGVGGLPLGRIVEIYGPESSGKTTICLHTVANAQKKGYTAAIIDMEHALDMTYAKNLGVDTDELLFAQPDYGEQAFNVIKELADTGEVDVIVLDSIAACVPKSEMEGEVGDANVGKQARMLSQALRILAPIISKNNVLLIMCNQIRMKIGVMWGNPETTAGGEATKFYASMRLEVRKSLGKEGDDVTYNKTKVKIVKNKVAPPYKTAEFNVLFGTGIDAIGEVIERAHELGVIKIWGKT